jgi:4-amino-4-deoxy-L-arabinose transferase-like glycosyltransferase
VPPYLATIGFALVVVLTYQIFSSQPLIKGDLSTYLLPAKYWTEGWGSLYVDVFDLKPPMTFGVLVPWVAAAGWSLVGFWILYAGLLAAMATFFWLLLRRLLPPWPALAVFSSACVVLVGFSMLEEIFFITEVVGLVLTLGGLWLAQRWGARWFAMALAGLAMGTAGQVKEIFLLVPLALLPAVVARPDRRWWLLASAAGGVLVAWLVTAASLVAWGTGSFGAYLEVLAFKRQRFPAPDIATVWERLQAFAGEIASWLPFVGVTVVAVAVLAVLSLSRRRREAVTTTWNAAPDGMAAGILFAVMVVGLVWQGAPLIRHYAVALVPPLFLLLGAAVGWGWARRDSLRPGVRVAVSIALISGLLPAFSAVGWSLGRARTVDPVGVLQAAGKLESAEARGVFTAISAATDPSDCIQVAYGWSATAYYLYSDRAACSRFVVPPLALDPMLRSEMQESLIARPPALLVVDRSLALETALPTTEGTPDEVIFPFQAVADECYAPVSGSDVILVPRGSASETAACISRQVDLMRSSLTGT